MREFDEFKMDANPKRLRKTNPSNAETTEKQIAEDSSSFNNDKEVSHVPTWLKVGGILFTGLVIPGLIGTMVYFATTSSPTPYRREQSDSGSGVCYTLYPDIVRIQVHLLNYQTDQIQLNRCRGILRGIVVSTTIWLFRILEDWICIKTWR